MSLISHLALPNREDFPTVSTQGFYYSAIAGRISFTFFLPVVRVVDRRFAFTLAEVHVPKTSVHIDYLFAAKKNDVGSTGKFSTMEAKPIAKTVDHPSHNHLWLSVARFHSSHHPGTFSLGEFLRHILIGGANNGSRIKTEVMLFRILNLFITV
jgi:hypothetical protein